MLHPASPPKPAPFPRTRRVVRSMAGASGACFAYLLLRTGISPQKRRHSHRARTLYLSESRVELPNVSRSGGSPRE
jgi:hypothetical protein